MIFNFLAVGIILLGVGVGWVINWFVSLIGIEEVARPAGGLACCLVALVADFRYRWRQHRDEGKARFISHETGGQVFFVPLWVIAAGLLLAFTYKSVFPGDPQSNASRPVSTRVRRDWPVFHSPEGGFRRRFPGRPETNETEHTTFVNYFDRSRRLLLGVRYRDRSDTAMPADDEGRLAAVVSGAVEEFNGTLDKEEPTSLKGHRGTAIALTGRVDTVSVTSRQRIYVTPNRTYQVLALGLGRQIPQQDAEDFFASFEFLER